MAVDTSIAPGQFYAKRWAIYSALGEPRIKLEAWHLSVKGLVENELALSFEELQRLPQVKLTRDVHCVTAWSIKDVIWEGVAFRELAKLAKVKAVAKWVMFHCADGYTAPVPLEDAMVEDGGQPYSNRAGLSRASFHPSSIRLEERQVAYRNRIHGRIPRRVLGVTLIPRTRKCLEGGTFQDP